MQIISLLKKTVARFPILVILCVALLSAFVTGCATPVELPPQITQNLTELRGQLLQGKGQVQTTCNVARDLTQRPQGQVASQVNDLIKNIASLTAMATNGKREFSTADERAQAYFADWDRQMGTLSASLAEQGQERRAESMESFAELKEQMKSLKKEFRPFIMAMQDVSGYLQADPTSPGVKVVTPKIEDALDNEAEIMEQIDEVIAQIDILRGGK